MTYNPLSPPDSRHVPASNIKYFLSFFVPHIRLFLLDMLCAVFISAVDLFFPIISRYILNDLLKQFDLASYETVRSFAILLAVILLCYFIRFAAQWFVTYFGHMFGVYVEADMRRDIFAHLEKQTFSFFDTHRTGKIMSRATYDLFEVSELSHHGPEDLFISITTLTGAIFFLFYIRWEIALVITVLLPVLILRVYFSKKNMMSASKTVKEKTADMNAEIESAVSGVRVTKAFTNEEYENRRFGEINKRFFSAKSGYYRTMATFHSQIDFMMNLLNVMVLAAGGIFIMRGKMTFGDYVAVNLFVAAFVQPIKKLSNFMEQYSSGISGFQRFAEIMRSDDETPEKPGAKELTDVLGNVEYENVDFAYKNGVQVLKNVNISVRSGQKLALVGPSGSGKTTLCNLLPRFYELQGGNIRIDGHDIRDITVKSLRSCIGIVQQDVFLFADTIKANIAYGRPDASEREIIEAAKRAEIHDDIMNMKDGYDTMVGERGIKLSGGQKQRVSIARIFLKNPPILILDEATSALDTATEMKIQKSFEELSEGRTTFVIAHRLSTVKNAKIIAVVDNEGITECGTHDELMKSEGLYSSLYTAQFGD
ncbi:ABC transporter ATP-binding protein [Treponema parvum]|uniref:ABC transporter ATP-binding protein n=2 Tax=Treponema parvum TaxID=138851 RepID=A0A975IDD6_9SPIR|nr:ABC transporter ATP-binding protein [Treponema parvum]